MAWVSRNGVQVWDGEPFPEPREDELAAYRFRRDPHRPVMRPHGTEAAAKRHERAHEPLCDQCQGAAAQARRARDRRSKMGSVAS